MARILTRVLLAIAGAMVLVMANTPQGRALAQASLPGIQIFGIDGTTLRQVAVDSSGALATNATFAGTADVNIAQINGVAPLAAATATALQSAAVANGNGSTLTVNGYATVVFSVNCSVSCTGGTTINFEGTEDGTNYEALVRTVKLGTPATTGATVVNQASGTVTLFRAPISGLQAVRARISGYSAGTVTVTGRAVAVGGPELITVLPVAVAAGGASPGRYISAGATEDEHAVCTGPCNLYSITATNTNAAVRYLKCENDTAAGTAPGTDTPEFGMAVPGAATGGGFTTSFPVGKYFSTALTCWLVTGAADSDVAEVAANELMVNYDYKQ